MHIEINILDIIFKFKAHFLQKLTYPKQLKCSTIFWSSWSIRIHLILHGFPLFIRRTSRGLQPMKINITEKSKTKSKYKSIYVSR